MECGCTAVVTVDLDIPRRTGDGVQGRVVHCPKHAEVDNLLAALDRIEKEAAAAGGVWARRIARKAAAKARGGAA